MQLSANFVPWAWAILAVLVAALELHAPGYYLIWVACAAGLTAVLNFLATWSLSGQLAIFSVSVVVSCVFGYFVYRRLDVSSVAGVLLNRRDLDLVGTFGTAGQTFVNGQGKARIGDTLWLAEANEDMPAGTPIVVQGIRGTTLIVSRRSQPA